MDLDAFCAQYAISLNPQQRAAVLRDRGETLLLAVPGSGKTTVLIARIGYLIFCKGVPAENILCITYTRAAAEEMETRFQKKFGTESGSPNFATINSLCVQIIRYARDAHGLAVPTLEPNTRRLIRAAMKDTKDVWLSDNTVQVLEQVLTRSKNRMTSKAELEAMECPELAEDCPDMSLAEFNALYKDYKEQHRRMDFDDQLIRAYRILRKYPDVREHFKSQYPHISLDEAQDTSPVQFAILEMLTEGCSSYFVVGDDDQSIYAFRGADPQYILHFQDHFPEAEVLYLETNYRSGKYIVEIANQFVARNRCRYAKTAVADSNRYGEIHLLSKPSEDQVYEEVLRTISDALETGETVAVLARNNYMLLPIAATLDQMDLQVNRRCSFESFLAQPLISGIVAALTLAVCPDRFSALRKARRTLGFYLKNDRMDALETACAAQPGVPVLTVAQALFAKEKTLLKRLQRAEVLVNALAEWQPLYAVQYLRKAEEDKHPNDLDENFPLDMLELMAERQLTIAAFLDELEQCKSGRGDRRSNITLTTIHSAKGLEFDRVILLDAFQGILPQEDENWSQRSPEEAEEDARLFYVAITRAKRRVDIYVPDFFGYQVVLPSPFLKRMYEVPGEGEREAAQQPEETAPAAEEADSVPVPAPEKNLQAGGMPVPGYRVRHGILGTGTVAAVIGDKLIVRFDSGAERTIAWCNWI